MREYCAERFDPAAGSRFRSWRFISRSFAPAFAALTADPENLAEHGRSPALWETRSKFVLLLTAPDGTRAVYKSYRATAGIFRRRFRFAPTTVEAANCALVATLGIPMPEVLAVGETRSAGRLTGAFLITRYAENFTDGRVFTPGGPRAEETAARDEFTREHLRLLAKLHDAGFRHKGFHPGNLLVGPPEAVPRMLWIDVAECRRFAWGCRRRQTARDLTEYFRCFNLDAGQRREFILAYLADRRRFPPPAAPLIAAVERALRRRGSRRLPPPVPVPPR